MDTKLRSTRYSVWLKVLALACAVGGVLLMAAGLMRYEGLSTALEPDNYLYTSDLRQWVGSVLSTVEGAELTLTVRRRSSPTRTGTRRWTTAK